MAPERPPVAPRLSLSLNKLLKPFQLPPIYPSSQITRSSCAISTTTYSTSNKPAAIPLLLPPPKVQSLSQVSMTTIHTAGGDLSFLAGGDLTLGSLQSNGGDITLLGTDLILFGSVNAGTGDLMLRASKNRDTGGTIGLGGISIAETSTLCNGAACDFTVRRD